MSYDVTITPFMFEEMGLYLAQRRFGFEEAIQDHSTWAMDSHADCFEGYKDALETVFGFPVTTWLEDDCFYVIFDYEYGCVFKMNTDYYRVECVEHMPTDKIFKSLANHIGSENFR